jgi:hypothetical protein
MGIKRLKKENEFLNMSIGDMLAKFDTSKTKKYSQFLAKMLNERIEEWNKNNLPEPTLSRQTPLDKAIPNNSFENTLVRSFICDWLFCWGNMERFVEFTELMEKGLVKENDISKYDSWNMLEIELFEAKNREMFKKSKKEIHKIFEDENYMIFKPLTYLSSCSYGYQTKWCTAMINEPNYFYNHSRGILIYLIDKKENKKFAFYKSVPQPYEMDEYNHENYVFKTYNQEDKQIDTIQTGLPMNILQIIMMECDTKSPTIVPNYKLFSDDEKNIMREHVGKLPEEYEEVKIRFNSDELPGLNLHPVAALGRQLRRRNTFIPLSALEPHGEDFEPGMEEINDECVMKEEYATQEKILEMRVDIAREELEQQIMEHLMKESNDR